MKSMVSVLEYDLQFFALFCPGGEKTEQPTAKKLTDARNEGNVAKSKDLVSAVSLIVSFVLLKFLVGNIGTGLMNVYGFVYKTIATLSVTYADEITYNNVVALLKDVALDGVLIVLPLFAISFVIAFVGDLLQVKWKVTTKPMRPKLNKLSIKKGVKHIFSKQSLVNLVKSVALVLIIGTVVIQTIKSKQGVLFRFYEVPLMTALQIIGDIVFDLGIKISAIYLIVGIGDYIYQKIKFKNDMMMTKQEVKDEYKNSEGDPQIKSKIRQKMRQASMRRMMQDLPKADVVITNPTHFAVALQYDLQIAKAPRVIAKGEDFLAQKIKEAAREHNIEIVENKPLARALYANVDIGEEIPEELYQAVAEVLAYVYNIKNKTAVRE